ncbi:MAG: STAS domain-containing protein [Planctomycetes bacterium]|nr:STAS domain-containing protein [Planctomycetota bacterium]
MTTEVTERGAFHVVRITPARVETEREVEQIAFTLNALVSEIEKPRLVVDLSGVEFLTSRVLGHLVALRSRAEAKEGSLAIAGVSFALMEVLRLTRLLPIFPLFPTADEAVRRAT